jgi:hypothetical protein
MPCMGFELPIPASERAQTVQALDRSATVTGHTNIHTRRNYKDKRGNWHHSDNNKSSTSAVTPTIMR